MHSSGMCTACLLTISQHALCRGLVFVSQHALAGVSEKAGVYLPRGCLPRGVSAQEGTCLGGVHAQGCTCPGGVPVGGVPRWVYLPGGVCPGVYLPRGCLPRGVYLPRRCTCQRGVSQHAMGQTPPCGQTDTCENITFANFVCGR